MVEVDENGDTEKTQPKRKKEQLEIHNLKQRDYNNRIPPGATSVSSRQKSVVTVCSG